MTFIKTVIIGLSLLLFSFYSFGQSKKPPKETFYSIENLSNFLCENIKSDEKKVKAIHFWVTKNIQYDFTIDYNEIPYFPRSADEVLMYGSAQSEGYVQLMRALLKVQDINSELVLGYSRPPINDTVLLPVMNDHAWIAIDLNGNWKLADPTWDAGYVGYEKTKKQAKVYKIKREWRNKRYRKMHDYQELLNSAEDEAFKSEVKEQILITRAKLEEERLKDVEKIDDMPDFTNKIVFHWVRPEKYFLIDTDTFLSTHLPANPMWQLREDLIDIESFMDSEENIRQHLECSGDVKYNFKDEISEYAKLNEVEKRLIDADKALIYNPQNFRIKAEIPFLIVKPYLNTSKNSLNNENTLTKQDLYNHIDSSIKYIKLSNKNEGPYFKFIISYYKGLYKEGKSLDKMQNRMIARALSWNEKAISQIDRSKSNIDRDIDKWTRIKGKLFPYTRFEHGLNSMDLSDFTHIRKDYADSLSNMLSKINKYREIWKGQLKESALKGIGDAQCDQNRLLQENTYFLRERTMENNDILLRNHHAFVVHHQYIEKMYADSLKNEMYNKAYVDCLSNFYKLTQLVSREIQVNSSGVPIEKQKATNRMLNAYTQMLIERFLDDYKETDLHFLYLRMELRHVNNYWKKLLRTSESQLLLEEQKKNFIVRNIGMTKRREENKLFLMKSQLKHWKKEIKEGKVVIDKQDVVDR